MNSPKLAFACIPFALLAPFVVSVATPRANDAVVIAVDAFGRPVPGLELEVVLRAKDGALTRTTEKPSAKTGKARVKVGEAALADVNVKGDFDVVAQTSWKEKDTRHMLLTVVPLVPFEARFTTREGAPQTDVAVVFSSPSWRDTSVLGSDGEATENYAFFSDSSGVVRGKVPRNIERIDAMVPGSFKFSPGQAAPVEGYSPFAEAVPLHAGGHSFEFHLPRFAERLSQWLDGEEAPVAGVRVCAHEPALVTSVDYLDRFSKESGDDGLITLLEALDSSGETIRMFNELANVRRGDDTFVMSIPPISEQGVVATMTAEVARFSAPTQPSDFAWTWYAHSDMDIRERVDRSSPPQLWRGRNRLWLAPSDANDDQHVAMLQATVRGALDTPIEWRLVDTVVDITRLPKGRWTIESTTVLVEEDDVYIDVTDAVELDSKGRAKTFGVLAADSSRLFPNGPGLASGNVTFVQNESGVPVIDGEFTALEFEFVRPDGTPAAHVCFVARSRDPESLANGTDTRPAWSDENGRATVAAIWASTFDFELSIFAQQDLIGTEFEIDVEAGAVNRVVVPDTGRLSIDGPALVGGDPRPLEIRFAPFVEGDERDVYERDAASRKLLTNADGKLVVDDVPVGSYVFQISETAVMSPSLGGLHRVEVTAPKAKR